MLTDYSPKPRTKLQFVRLFVSESEMTDIAALNWLRNEIRTNKLLSKKLQQYGYKSTAKMLTIAQQRLICEAFGVKSSDDKVS